MAYRQQFGGNYDTSYNHNNLGASNASRNFKQASFRCIYAFMQTTPRSMADLDRSNSCWRTRGTNSERRGRSWRWIWTTKGREELNSRTNWSNWKNSLVENRSCCLKLSSKSTTCCIKIRIWLWIMTDWSTSWPDLKNFMEAVLTSSKLNLTWKPKTLKILPFSTINSLINSKKKARSMCNN